jgi:uncharacterized protein (UPF0332 family)
MGDSSVPNDNRKALSAYRINRAKDSIEAAEKLIEDGLYLDSINRTYYAIFHSMRAVPALESIDFKRHSSVISHFHKEYIKTGIFDKGISKYIMGAFDIRNESDYVDFFIVTKTDAENQLKHAKAIAKSVHKYIESVVKDEN